MNKTVGSAYSPGRNVTAEERDGEGRFVLYSLCLCAACAGSGKKLYDDLQNGLLTERRCEDCRGEGRTRREIASATDEQSLGVALVTLAREGEWDDGCPLGLLDREGETGLKWLVSPWLPSARNVTDAAKLLRSQQKGKT